ncbi:hypothetical protein ACKWTF_000482 [Chironomus riparius]
MNNLLQNTDSRTLTPSSTVLDRRDCHDYNVCFVVLLGFTHFSNFLCLSVMHIRQMFNRTTKQFFSFTQNNLSSSVQFKGLEMLIQNKNLIRCVCFFLQIVQIILFEVNKA